MPVRRPARRFPGLPGSRRGGSLGPPLLVEVVDDVVLGVFGLSATAAIAAAALAEDHLLHVLRATELLVRQVLDHVEHVVTSTVELGRLHEIPLGTGVLDPSKCPLNVRSRGLPLGSGLSTWHCSSLLGGSSCPYPFRAGPLQASRYRAINLSGGLETFSLPVHFLARLRLPWTCPHNEIPNGNARVVPSPLTESLLAVSRQNTPTRRKGFGIEDDAGSQLLPFSKIKNLGGSVTKSGVCSDNGPHETDSQTTFV